MMELKINSFITILLAVLLVSVFGQEGGYAGRQRRPRPEPDCIQVGVCGGFARAVCPHGSTCRLIWPTSTAGPCCRDDPEPPHNVCSYGTPGGSCRRTSQCSRGYTCQREPGRRRGTCCMTREEEPPHNVCSYGAPGGSCRRTSQCSRGYTCQREPRMRRGTCCMTREEGTCPPSSGRPGICVFDPRVNCLSNRDCGRGQICCSEGCGRVCKNPVNYPDQVLY